VFNVINATFVAVHLWVVSDYLPMIYGKSTQRGNIPMNSWLSTIAFQCELFNERLILSELSRKKPTNSTMQELKKLLAEEYEFNP
jgi:hypothetical protein